MIKRQCNEEWCDADAAIGHGSRDTDGVLEDKGLRSWRRYVNCTRTAMRRELAWPQWEMLKHWCMCKMSEVPEDTLTYKAMGYLLRHYDELTAYMDIAEMPVDNNDTEREIRSMVMGKQSYLFCRTEEACHRAALMYSMLGACKVLGKDSEKWLAYTLKHIGSTKPEDQHRLLPEEWTE